MAKNNTTFVRLVNLDGSLAGMLMVSHACEPEGVIPRLSQAVADWCAATPHDSPVTWNDLFTKFNLQYHKNIQDQTLEVTYIPTHSQLTITNTDIMAGCSPVHDRMNTKVPPVLRKVISSTVAGFGYDPETCKLYVSFNSGGTYVFDDVPKTIYENMLRADSVGSYFAKEVKGKFPSAKYTMKVDLAD